MQLGNISAETLKRLHAYEVFEVDMKGFGLWVEYVWATNRDTRMGFRQRGWGSCLKAAIASLGPPPKKEISEDY